jgi:hypothetical protein
MSQALPEAHPSFVTGLQSTFPPLVTQAPREGGFAGRSWQAGVPEAVTKGEGQEAKQFFSMQAPSGAASDASGQTLS